MTSFLNKFEFSKKALVLRAVIEVWFVYTGTRRIGKKQGELACVAADHFFRGGNEFVVTKRQSREVVGRILPSLPAQQLRLVTDPQKNLTCFKEAVRRLYACVYQVAVHCNRSIESTPLPKYPVTREHLKAYPKKAYKDALHRMLSEAGPDAVQGAWGAGLCLSLSARRWFEAVKLFNGLRNNLPFLVAISLRDPRRLHGYKELMEILESDYLPPWLQSYEQLEELAEEQGFSQDPDRCKWLVHISPSGRVEVRAFDVQEDHQQTTELAAVLHVLGDQILTQEKPSESLSEEDLRDQFFTAIDNPAALQDNIEAWAQGLCRHAKEAGMKEELGYIISLMRRKKLDLGPADKLVS